MEVGAISAIRPYAVGETRPAPDPSSVFAVTLRKEQEDAPDSFRRRHHQGSEESEPEEDTPAGEESAQSDASGTLSVFA